MRLAWANLPREDAALFNPAFLALLLARSADGHAREVNRPIPIPLSFLAVSVALNRSSRESLPRTIRTNLLRWMDENPEEATTLAVRASAIAPAAREALLFAIAHGVCEIAPDATIRVPVKRRLGPIRGATAEVEATQRAADFLGRWFGRAGSPATVLALLGVHA
jgi:hypothetical protein